MAVSQGSNALLAKSLLNRAVIANALCAIAEEQAHSGNAIRAVETVRALRGVLDEVSLVLTGDTSNLPFGTLQDVADLINGLGARITAVEKALRLRPMPARA